MELQPLLVRLRRVRDPAVPKSVWLSTLATLLWEVSEIAEDATVADPPSPPYMQELLRYVVEHTEENLTLDMLSEKFFVSRSKLIHDFRTAVRMSLHEYITSIRIHRAKILLADGLPLAMIAQQCGFSNDSAFIYMFRRQTGMTPGFYRKSFDRH
jgi:AraC-like DNA-binding protein